MYPLHDAVIETNFSLIKSLIEQNKDINEKDLNQNSSLHLACELGSKEIVEFLIQKGANINSENSISLILKLFIIYKFKSTPLHIACCFGHHYLIELFNKKGANLNKKNDINILYLSNIIDIFFFNGFSPIHNAAKSGHLETIKVLYSFGVNINEKNNEFNLFFFI